MRQTLADAFEDLFRTQSGALRAYLIRRGCDPGSVWDVVSETFAVAYESCSRQFGDTVDASHDLQAVLYRTAHYQLLHNGVKFRHGTPVRPDHLAELISDTTEDPSSAESPDIVELLLDLSPTALGETLAELLRASRELGLDIGPVDERLLRTLREADPERAGLALHAQLRKGQATGLDLAQILAPLSGATILGPDGKPVEEGPGGPLDVSVRSMGKEILAHFAKNPELVHALAPREFEELVAELFARQGYQVTLTAATRDGGVDLYVVDNTDFGSFLYLVECKKYRADRPVGVGVIRDLFGVVQANRASAGIVATTSFFTGDALAWAQPMRYQLSLRDFVALRAWLAKASAA